MNIMVKESKVFVFRNTDIMLKSMGSGGISVEYSADFIFQKDATGAWNVVKDRSGYFNTVIPSIEKAIEFTKILIGDQ